MKTQEALKLKERLTNAFKGGIHVETVLLLGKNIEDAADHHPLENDLTQLHVTIGNAFDKRLSLVLPMPDSITFEILETMIKNSIDSFIAINGK